MIYISMGLKNCPYSPTSYRINMSEGHGERRISCRPPMGSLFQPSNHQGSTPSLLSLSRLSLALLLAIHAFFSSCCYPVVMVEGAFVEVDVPTRSSLFRRRLMSSVPSPLSSTLSSEVARRRRRRQQEKQHPQRRRLLLRDENTIRCRLATKFDDDLIDNDENGDYNDEDSSSSSSSSNSSTNSKLRDPKFVTRNKYWVIIVDDEEPIREAVGNFLYDSGYQVTACSDADALLEVCATTSSTSNNDDTVQQDDGTLPLPKVPDAIISDVRMPGKDGIELLGLIRADERLERVPVILLTAKALTQDRILGYKVRTVAFLFVGVCVSCCLFLAE